jgi:hypothetical protein
MALVFNEMKTSTSRKQRSKHLHNTSYGWHPLPQHAISKNRKNMSETSLKGPRNELHNEKGFQLMALYM